MRLLSLASFLFIFTLMNFAVAKDRISCENSPSLSFLSPCSEQMNEAITYKETSESKEDALKDLSPLCETVNEFIPMCIIFSKDGGIKDRLTIFKVCQDAKELSPLCILTAKSKNLSNENIVKLCSDPSMEKIECIQNNKINNCID